MDPEPSSSSRGSALLLVLWSLVLLTMAVFGVVEIVQASVGHSAHLELATRARALALSGLAVAIHPQMERTDSLLHQQPAAGQKWDVELRGEAGRLNLNYVLASGHPEILARLFVLWGLKDEEARYAADCLYNWVTPDENSQIVVRAGTSPDKPNPPEGKRADYDHAGLTHYPTGHPFGSMTEITYVLGMDAVEKAHPDWQKSFTLWDDGPLDVNEAPDDLLAAVLDLPLSQTKAFVEHRNGRDGLPETDDDVRVSNKAALKSALGLSEKTLSSLGNQLGFNDNVRRVESKGESNGVTVTLSVITRLKSSPPEYLSWTEQ